MVHLNLCNSFINLRKADLSRYNYYDNMTLFETAYKIIRTFNIFFKEQKHFKNTYNNIAIIMKQYKGKY